MCLQSHTAATLKRWRIILPRPGLKKIWRIVTLKLPLHIIERLMEKIREIIAFKNYFEDFLKEQPIKVQNKIFKILEAIETLERIPTNYLKLIVGTSGLYEARIQLGSDIWRVFCFFDKGKLVILLNGFQKKTQKTPINEIEKAITLMKAYYENRK
jgi:phage-related protein